MSQTVRATPRPPALSARRRLAITLALLLGMARWDTLWVDPHVADTFHAHIRQALEKSPRHIYPWSSTDEAIPQSAVQLLKPNAMLCRRFQKGDGTWATLLLSQCRDARDMLGHYPPICYRGQGYQIVGRQRQEWKAADMTIDGIEYEISRQEGSVREKMFVRDFFVLPDGRIVADMDAVTAASKDYRALAFGVAQIQLMCDGRSTLTQRDAIFSALIGENTDLIKALGSARDAGDKL